jgi:hypothetical protein
VLESFKPQLDELRAYWQAAFNKHKAGIERRNALRQTLAKLKKVKGPLRNGVLIAATQRRIDRLNEQLADLRDLMSDVAAEILALDQTAHSEAQRAADEAEREAAAAVPSTPSDSEGGGGGGATTAGGESEARPVGPPTLTAAQIAAMRAEFLSARSGFFAEFGPNVFRGTPGLLELGSGPLAPGGGQVMVVQNFQTPPPDLHAYFQSAQFAAEHALG